MAKPIFLIKVKATGADWESFGATADYIRRQCPDYHVVLVNFSHLAEFEVLNGNPATELTSDNLAELKCTISGQDLILALDRGKNMGIRRGE